MKTPQPETNQGFPIETHKFYNWSTVNSLVGDDIIENILRVDEQFWVEHFIQLEHNEPRVTQNIFKDVFKLQQECIDYETIDPYTEALDIVNLMDHNKECLDRPELLSIQRVMDFSQAYKYLFNHLVNYFEITG